MQWKMGFFFCLLNTLCLEVAATPENSCSKISREQQSFNIILGKDYEAAIVPQEEAWKFNLQSIHVNIDLKYWTPTEDQILELESKLKHLLKKAARREAPWRQLAEYRRQYVGYILQGRKRIFGNFFCDDLGHDWTKRGIIVSDGGPCFFEIDYDLESKSLVNVFVHGSG